MVRKNKVSSVVIEALPNEVKLLVIKKEQGVIYGIEALPNEVKLLAKKPIVDAIKMDGKLILVTEYLCCGQS